MTSKEENETLINKTYGVNAIDSKELHAKIAKVLGLVSRVVRNTLGPYGGNTLIADPYATTPVSGTKDGYRVMLNMQFDDMIDNSIYQIIRDLSFRMNARVGDSTTSGNIILNILFRELRRLAASTDLKIDPDDDDVGYDSINSIEDIVNSIKPKVRTTPFAVKSILERLEARLIEVIEEKYVYPIQEITDIEKRREIYQKVATVAANNDSNVGKIVADIFASRNPKEEVFVDITRSNDEETHIESSHGFELGTGYLDQMMVNQSDGVSCEYRDAKVLVILGPLTDNDVEIIYHVLTILKQKNTPLVVFAQEFTPGVQNQLLKLRAGVPMKDGSVYQAKIVCIPLDSGSINAKNRAKDLAASVGAIPLPTRKGKIVEFSKDELDAGLLENKYLGEVGEIKVMPNHTRIINGRGNDGDIESRIKTINEQIESYTGRKDIDASSEINILRRRIGMLRCNMAAIHVGGRSYKEKDSQYYLYEDAVYAVRSVLKNGVTCGGNVSVPHAIANNFEVIAKKVVEELIEEEAAILVGNDEEDIKHVVNYVLNIVAHSFTAAFRWVIMAATENEEAVKKVVEDQMGFSFDSNKLRFSADEDLKILNLRTNKLEVHSGEYDHENHNLIVAGNTDVELIRTIFTVCITFLTANQFMAHPLIFNNGNQSR